MADAPKQTRRTASADRLRALSAARMQPVKERPSPKGPVSARLKEGAAETALNVAGILRDLWADFRSSDQFFKYKAGIVAAWVLLSTAALFVACPSSGPTNEIGARVVVTQVAGSPVYMVVNDSGDAWEDVVVVVNDQYRAAVGRVAAEHLKNNLTLEPKKLLAEGGQPAPRDLRAVKIEVKTASGRAELVDRGQGFE